MKVVKWILLFLILIFLATWLVLSNVSFGKPSKKLSSLSPKSVTDMHVHVAGLGYGDSGCFVHDDLNSSYKRSFYLEAFGVSQQQLEENGDAFLVEHLSKLVEGSRYLKQVVVLALDATFDIDGVMQKDLTQIYVPNDFVKEQTRLHKNLLYGASIHPYRKDAIARLRQAKADGAILIKWIPPIMHMDPADKRITNFYKELVVLDLPLLTHAGQERAFASSIDNLGDPLRLELPLSLGVKVIAAHIATTGEVDGEPMIDRLLPMFEKYPNLYGDISSLTQANKLQYVEQALLNKNIHSKVLYGSDWPLQFFPLVSPWLHFSYLPVADIQAIEAEENVFDKDITLKLALGLPPKVFAQTAEFLNISRK